MSLGLPVSALTRQGFFRGRFCRGSLLNIIAARRADSIDFQALSPEQWLLGTELISGKLKGKNGKSPASRDALVRTKTNACVWRDLISKKGGNAMENYTYTSPLLVGLGSITDVTFGQAEGTIIDDAA